VTIRRIYVIINCLHFIEAFTQTLKKYRGHGVSKLNSVAFTKGSHASEHSHLDVCFLGNKQSLVSNDKHEGYRGLKIQYNYILFL
jgi:hypothetical protein